MPFAGATALGQLWGKVKENFAHNVGVSLTSEKATIKLKKADGSDLGDAIEIGRPKTVDGNDYAGLMTRAEKDKLSGIATNANKTVESDISGWGFTKNAGTITKVKTTAGTHSAIEVSSGQASFNVPTTTAHITVPSGYAKASTAADVAANDTVSTALGKIEKKIDAKTSNAGTITGVTGSNGLTGSGTSGSVTISHATPTGAAAKSSGLYKIATDERGHVTGATAVAKSDITALGIPAQDTTYDLSGYAPKASPALTGTPTAPTAAAGTNTTQLATTAFVNAAISAAQTGASMFQGTLAAQSTLTNAAYKKGWYWVVSTAGTYAGQSCEVGDMMFAIKDKGASYAAGDFSGVQNNIVEMTAAEVDAICV